MTTELEQEFFKTFKIEPKKLFSARQGINPDAVVYPEITAKKLLEMICIYNNNVCENEKITPSNINTLKKDVLHWIITDFEENDKFKHQIQQLFKD